MYFFLVIATPTEQHPDHASLGEGYISCWIDRDTEQAALAVAHAMIREDDWEILRTEETAIVTDEDFPEDDEDREYYEQALIDKEVFVFHVSPRFPAYYMNFSLQANEEAGSPVEARAWLLNECVYDGHDMLAADYWSGERIEKAISLTTEVLVENGHTVDQLLEQAPCGRDESSEDVEFYDAAEEDGLCLVLVFEDAK